MNGIFGALQPVHDNLIYRQFMNRSYIQYNHVDVLEANANMVDIIGRHAWCSSTGPISIDMICAMEHLLHNLRACLKWKGDDISSDIIVMNLHTGDVTSHTETEGLYATHHINAYEIVNGREGFQVQT